MGNPIYLQQDQQRISGVFRKIGKDPAEAFTQGSSNQNEERSSNARPESPPPPPEPQRQSKTQSSSSASDDFWNRTRAKTAEERQRRQQNENRSQKSSSQSSSRQEEKKTDSRRSHSSSSQQSRQSHQTENKGREDGGAANQGRSKPKSADAEESIKPSRATDPPLSTEERDLLSQGYYERHRALFEKAGWELDPWECTLDPHGNRYETLKVSANDDRQQIKKAYFQLSKKYRRYTSDAYPDELKARADLIGRILSSAHTRILKGK